MLSLATHPQRNTIRLQLRQNQLLQGMTSAQWSELEPLLLVADYRKADPLVRQGDEYIIKYLDPRTLPKLKVDKRLAVPGRHYGVQGEKLDFLEKRVPANPKELSVDFYAELYKSIRKGKALFIKPEEVYEQMRVNALARKGTGYEV